MALQGKRLSCMGAEAIPNKSAALRPAAILPYRAQCDLLASGFGILSLTSFQHYESLMCWNGTAGAEEGCGDGGAEPAAAAAPAGDHKLLQRGPAAGGVPHGRYGSCLSHAPLDGKHLSTAHAVSLSSACTACTDSASQDWACLSSAVHSGCLKQYSDKIKDFTV